MVLRPISTPFFFMFASFFHSLLIHLFRFENCVVDSIVGFHFLLPSISHWENRSTNRPNVLDRTSEEREQKKKRCRAIKIMIFFSFLNKFEKSPSNQKNDKRPENRQQTTTGKRNSLHWHEFHSKEHSLNITFRLISNWMLFYSSSKSERASARANTNIFHSFFH